jgi:hypothetical protein
MRPGQFTHAEPVSQIGSIQASDCSCRFVAHTKTKRLFCRPSPLNPRLIGYTRQISSPHGATSSAFRQTRSVLFPPASPRSRHALWHFLFLPRRRRIGASSTSGFLPPGCATASDEPCWHTLQVLLRKVALGHSRSTPIPTLSRSTLLAVPGAWALCRRRSKGRQPESGHNCCFPSNRRTLPSSGRSEGRHAIEASR